MLSNFVAVEMTSHQTSPFPFESIPAWISMALAPPINVDILLSATDYCWGIPGAANSKIIHRFALSHSFCKGSVLTTVVNDLDLVFL